MNKINLFKFKEDIYLALSVLPISDLDRLLEFNKKYTADEVFINIVKDTLLTFERYYPYRTTLKLPAVVCYDNDVGADGSWVQTYYLESSGRRIKFYDNIPQVFYNIIPEDELSMIPLQVKALKNNRITDHPSLERNFKYERPYLYGITLGSFRYYSGLFQWPVFVDLKCTNVTQLERSWILLMDEGTNVYRTFKYAMIVRICEYIQNLKNNFSLPGLPVEVFGSLEQVASRYREIVQMEYTQALSSWGWD